MRTQRRKFLENLAVAGASSFLGGCGTELSGVSREIQRPLAFGYYGSDRIQLQETADHVNFHFVIGWGGRQDQVLQLTDLVGSKKKIVLGVLDWWFDESVQIETFQILQNLGLLQNIWALYPIDEPDRQKKTDSEVVQKNTRLRAACQAFPALQNVKLGVFYGPNGNYPGINSYDLVGFDHYGVDIFSNNEFTSFRGRTRDSQKIWIIPGASDPYRDDGHTFVQACNLFPEIVGIVPFLWLDNADPANGIGLGVRSNGLAPAYRALGKKILERGDPAWNF